MSKRSVPHMRIDELHRTYGDQDLSHARLLELLNTCVLNESVARGASAAVHHDLMVALLLLERAGFRGERGPSLSSRPTRAKAVRSLEAAARDLLSCVQNKQQPLSHPDNLRLTAEGDTILVNEARLWMLQLALPRRSTRGSSS